MTMRRRRAVERMPDGSIQATVVEEQIPAAEQAALDSVHRDIAKDACRERIREHAATLIAAHFPGFGSPEDMETLRWIFIATKPTTRSSELLAAANIVQYAKQKLQEVSSMTKTQADNYNPTTDLNWPS